MTNISTRIAALEARADPRLGVAGFATQRGAIHGPAERAATQARIEALHASGHRIVYVARLARDAVTGAPA